MTSDNRSRPRIAFVATDLSTGGGVNRVIRDLATMFSERLGYRVTVLNGRSSQLPTFRFSPDVELIAQPNQGRWVYIKALWALRCSLPDIVVGSWAQDNILIQLMFLFAPTRVVLVEHSSWHLHNVLVRLARRLAYPLADAVVVLNPSDLAYYRRFVRNVLMIPNPVESTDVAAPTNREKHIVAVGHLSDIKNFSAAIAAMARSKLEADGWWLTIVGSGPEERALREQVSSLGLRRTTILSPTNELTPIYRRSSLMLLTSRSESFSLVLAEAMAAGVVPLAYATDGPSFILEDFPELLVDIGDEATLATRLRELANSDDLEPLRQRLAESIRRRFSPDVIEAQWRDLIASRLAGRRGFPDAAISVRHSVEGEAVED